MSLSEGQQAVKLVNCTFYKCAAFTEGCGINLAVVNDLDEPGVNDELAEPANDTQFFSQEVNEVPQLLTKPDLSKLGQPNGKWGSV